MNRIQDFEEISEDLFFTAGSPAMRKLRTQAELLAKVNVPVLIVGENGSGKDVVARLIHKFSVRAACRFVKVNCAALPGDLLERELFGYKPGEFTATKGPGKFELCDQGTILLDEIAKMPAGLQAKLLHFLQDRQIFTSDGQSTISPDVRILAATTGDIEQALNDKSLREDLYYRLSAFTLHVPPLRERKQDIPLLLGHFINQLARHYGLKQRTLSPTWLEACQGYSWPGNLRELENVVKRYLVMGDESVQTGEFALQSPVHVRDADWPNCSPPETTPLRGNAHIESPASLKSLVRTIKGEAERNAIASTLEKTHWNRKEAARQLRISYRGLLYKIQEYQLAPSANYLTALPRNASCKRSGEQH